MRLRERFQRMMYGRYGSDQLSKFCFVLYLVIWVVGLFIRVPQVRIGLNLFSYVIIFVYFFRFFSKNIYKRQQENLKFMAVVESKGTRWCEKDFSLSKMSPDDPCAERAWKDCHSLPKM